MKLHAADGIPHEPDAAPREMRLPGRLDDERVHGRAVCAGTAHDDTVPTVEQRCDSDRGPCAAERAAEHPPLAAVGGSPEPPPARRRAPPRHRPGLSRPVPRRHRRQVRQHIDRLLRGSRHGRRRHRPRDLRRSLFGFAVEFL